MLNHMITKASFYTSLLPGENEIIANSPCYLLISVGQKYHESDKLQATIELINKKFASCTILLADTLQRFNLEPYFSGNIEKAYTISLESGDAWIARNSVFVKRFNIPFKLSRWDEWINNSQYHEAQVLFEKEYAQNEHLRNSIEASIDEYIERLNNRLHGYAKDYFTMRRQLCLQYLKEECAAMLLFARAGLGYEIYPTKRNAAMEKTYELLIKPYFSSQLRQLSLRFKKRKLNYYSSLASSQLEPLLAEA